MTPAAPHPTPPDRPARPLRRAVDRRDDRRAHARVGLAAAGFAAGMLGLAFASVPLYRWFCATTGYGGTPMVATAGPQTAPGRPIEVRFDTNVRGDLVWSFAAETRAVTVATGETTTVLFRIANTSDRPQTGVAAFNVTPPLAAAHFMKLACFCFEAQTLAAGETIEVPVTFWVDRDIDGDKNVAGLAALTLSYTFFPAATPSERSAGAAPADAAAEKKT